MDTLTISPRFCGPPTTGNGGYVCGCLGSRLGPSAEVTLRVPPPLDRPMAVVTTDADGLRLLDRDTMVAEAAPGDPAIDAPPAPDVAAAHAASSAYIGFRFHAFPTCFVCGPDRASGDGLRIFPGPVGDHEVVAPWVPDAGLAGPDGTVRPEFLWAALDCPGAFAAMGRLPGTFLLGRFTVKLLGAVRPGDPCTLRGWQLAVDGRKRHVATALYGPDGRPRGVARAIWFDMGAKS